MSNVFTYTRINKNNEKYTEEQKDILNNYVKKHNIDICKNIEIDISTPSDEKNILELLKKL